MDGGGISNVVASMDAVSAGNAEARGAIGFWTDLRIEQLKALWGDGDSASIIAKALGCSRNAVLGKVHRLELPNRIIVNSVERTRLSRRRDPLIIAENARARVKRYRDRLRKQNKSEVLAQFRACGSSPYSAAFRKHLPRQPEMTKGELRAMLAQAIANTARMT